LMLLAGSVAVMDVEPVATPVARPLLPRALLTVATAALEERAAKIREHGLATRWLLKTGVPHEEIVKTASEEGAAYVVMGTHGRGALERFLLGSVADRVVRTAPCPVVTVRQPEA